MTVNGVVEVQGVTSIKDASNNCQSQSKLKWKTMDTKTSLHMISTIYKLIRISTEPVQNE
jgi:hypothetical protein